LGPQRDPRQRRRPSVRPRFACLELRIRKRRETPKLTFPQTCLHRNRCLSRQALLDDDSCRGACKHGQWQTCNKRGPKGAPSTSSHARIDDQGIGDRKLNKCTRFAVALAPALVTSFRIAPQTSNQNHFIDGYVVSPPARGR